MMKPWFEEEPALPQDSVDTRQSVSYVEIQRQVANVPGKYFSYFLRTGENHILSVALLGLEEFFRTLEQQLLNPTLGSTWATTYRETWPTLFSMLDNSVNYTFSKGALLRIEDLDNGDQKWVIGTYVGNIDFSESSEEYKLVLDQRLLDAHILVVQSCARIHDELCNRKPSKLKLFFRGARAGGAEGRKLASQLESIVMPVLKVFFGPG
jgi:hypothetical protein